MLELTLPEVEGYDENTGRFVAAAPAVTLSSSITLSQSQNGNQNLRNRFSPRNPKPKKRAIITFGAWIRILNMPFLYIFA